MAIIHSGANIEPTKLELLTQWLPQQRWYTGKGQTPRLRRLSAFRFDDPEGEVGVETMIVLDESGREPVAYQVPVTYRATPLPGAEAALVGTTHHSVLGQRYVYDACQDPVYVTELLRTIVSGGREADLSAGTKTATVRGSGLVGRGSRHGNADLPVSLISSRVLSGEQSNTSVIVDADLDGTRISVICKVFRVLHAGRNPDVEVQTVLSASGSARVPAMLGSLSADWTDESTEGSAYAGDLAFAQEFLSDVQDAWREALVAAQAGADFTIAAKALGATTAEVHGLLATSMPTVRADADRVESITGSMRQRFAEAVQVDPRIAHHQEEFENVLGKAEATSWPVLQRIHGDYHLGQVLDVPHRGWVLLDFEGEPLRPLSERARPDTVLRDLAGMLRSFDYAAGAVTHAGGEDRSDWAADARRAFLRGYAAKSRLDLAAQQPILDAYELDKALYELVYESRNRPTWVPIPAAAVARLLGVPVDAPQPETSSPGPVEREISAQPDAVTAAVPTDHPPLRRRTPVAPAPTSEPDPFAVQPFGLEPVEPAVVEPAVVEPAVVEPAVVEPAVVEPAVVEPATPGLGLRPRRHVAAPPSFNVGAPEESAPPAALTPATNEADAVGQPGAADGVRSGSLGSFFAASRRRPGAEAQPVSPEPVAEQEAIAESEPASAPVVAPDPEAVTERVPVIAEPELTAPEIAEPAESEALIAEPTTPEPLAEPEVASSPRQSTPTPWTRAEARAFAAPEVVSAAPVDEPEPAPESPLSEPEPTAPEPTDLEPAEPEAAEPEAAPFLTHMPARFASSWSLAEPPAEPLSEHVTAPAPVVSAAPAEPDVPAEPDAPSDPIGQTWQAEPVEDSEPEPESEPESESESETIHEPEVTEPEAVHEPEAVEPEAVEPEVAHEPEAVEPEAVHEPEAVEPEAVEPEVAHEPEAVEPEAETVDEPEVAEPEAVHEPEVIEPEVIEPEVIEPEPEAAEPEAEVEPEVAEPEAVEPEAEPVQAVHEPEAVESERESEPEAVEPEQEVSIRGSLRSPDSTDVEAVDEDDTAPEPTDDEAPDPAAPEQEVSIRGPLRSPDSTGVEAGSEVDTAPEPTDDEAVDEAEPEVSIRGSLRSPDSTGVGTSSEVDSTPDSTDVGVGATYVPLAKAEADRLLGGLHRGPHGILGAHPGPNGVTVRVLRPFAKSVRIELAEGEPVELEHEYEGLWAGLVPGSVVPDYRVHATYDDGGEHLTDDPYRFLPTLGEVDIHLISEGRHEQLWTVLGAHVRTYPGQIDEVRGTSFAVWAPNARAIRLVGDFNQWDGSGHSMRVLGDSGLWELFVPGVEAGTNYKFEILCTDGVWRAKADPLARLARTAPETASVVTESAYEWNDADWLKQRSETDQHETPMSVYEVHLQSWRQGQSYRELAEHLVNYVKDLGFTHVELMPVMDHPYPPSWGYQVTSYYAPNSRMGSPDDFKYLVDQLHQNGIGVILDWVPGHFATDDWALARFDGKPVYENADPRKGWHPEWGSYIFDFGRPQVRNFLVANAIYWLEEFHADGLRVDAVASMLYLDYSRQPDEWVPNEHGGRENLDAMQLLQETNATAYKRVPGIVTIAEESTSWPGVTAPTSEGGLGFGLKWNMGWMHDSLDYLAKSPLYRQYHHHKMTFALTYAWTEKFVLPISHDEVVHGKGSLLRKMPGNRWEQLANLRAYFAYMWAHPGKQLLFMGTEFAQESEWADGRSLDWWLLDQPAHWGVHALTKDLNRLYREHPALWQQDHTPAGFHWIEPDDAARNTFSFLRFGEGEGDDRPVVAVVVNFSGSEQADLEVGLPHTGTWLEVLNTGATSYGGSGVGNLGQVTAVAEPAQGQPASAKVTVGPLSAVWLVPAPADSADSADAAASEPAADLPPAPAATRVAARRYVAPESAATQDSAAEESTDG